jgi:hypothetical protein
VLISAVVLSFTGINIRIVSEDYQLPALILVFTFFGGISL